MKTAIRMKHPLRSTGTHQTARLLRAIAPGHFRLDERSMQDLITAAHSYARMLTYVGPGGQADGDWTAFWEVENLTYMAVLAAVDTEQLRKGYEDIDLAFGQALLEQEGKSKKSKKNAAKDPISPDFFRQLLCYLRDMAAGLEKHYTTLRPEIPLKDLLLTLIRRDNYFPYEPDNVDSALQQLVAFHKAADDHLEPETYKTFCQSDSHWGIRNRDEYDCILPDETLDREKVRGLFVQFFNILLTLKARAQQMFDAEVAVLELSEETLERRLEPHIALFITFLQLFRHAQEGMNEIPRRHLDFYYHSVLCLERRPADPDHAYLVFTLAKEFNEELAEKGTLLLAGKDKNGRPIQFETLERWKVTKASIEEIRNTCIAPNFINASTISEKGIPPEKAFRAFGDDDTAPEGELGFAIASPQLFLQEGKREVEVRLELEGPIEYANEYPEFVKVEYSTADGYKKLDKLKADQSGFVFSPILLPFAVMQSVEPGRRLVNDLMADLCALTPDPALSSSTLPKDSLRDETIKFFKREDIADTNHFVFTKIFYPALSGVYAVKQLLDKDAIEQSSTKKLKPQFKAELYFYRAYYLYTLASVFAPAYQKHYDLNGDPIIVANETKMTIIPDLRNHILPGPPNIQPHIPFYFYELGNVYKDILSDLGKALDQWPSTASNTDDGKDTDSKTAINYFTVHAFLSRIYLQMGRWDDCSKACEEVMKNGKFKLDNGQAEPIARVSTSFDSVKNSPDVIWALETAQGAGEASLFDYFSFYDSSSGESPNRFFGESNLLDALYQGNKRYEERVPTTTTSGPDQPGDSTALAGSGNNSASGASAVSHYDPRDKAFFQLSKPIGQPEAQGVAFCSKYFRNNQTLVPMLRLSEVHLNKAQALFELDSTEHQPKIRTLINGLRKRAGALPFLTSETLRNGPNDGYQVKDIKRYHIEEERARELAFEGDRREFVRAAKSNIITERHLIKDVEVVSGEARRDLLPTDLTTGMELLGPTPSVGAVGDKQIPWNESKPSYSTYADRSKVKILEQAKTSSMLLKLVLKEDAPAFVPHNGLAQAGITPYPILRVAFGGTNAQSAGFYNFLQKQTLTKATIRVEVAGIQKSLILQNDFGVFDGTQRFYPFGPVPENSARFFLGCQEAFTKKLDSATVTFDWVEEEKILAGTKGYEDIYANYQTDIPNPKVSIDLLKDAEFGGNSLLSEGNLFTPPLNLKENSTTELAATKSKMVRSFENQKVTGFGRVISSEQVSKYSATQKRGFLRFKLEGDFGHKAFTNLTLKAATSDPKGTLPSEPYTPATNSVSLSYVSTQEMQGEIDKFFHVLPFQGGLHQADFSKSTSLVYDYPSPVAEPSTGGFYPANLFLGMSKLMPGDNLSLLFQTSEGSEKESDSRPPKVGWMYLTKDNEWVEFPVQKILRDTTRGLIRSGIIQLAIPNEISSKGNTMLNPGLLWLRASVVETAVDPEKVAAFPDLLDIRAQAIEARFLPAEGNDLERLESPLPARSVSGLAESSSAIKKAEQPYASFGGRKPENEGSSEYHRRVSERLRHKDRAITAWDYERLLLEQYPLAAIAKCIPHTRYEDTEGFSGATELAPGFVTVAVVPDLVRRPNMVRVEPRFSRGDLEEMRDFLVPKATAFVQTVENKATDKRTDYLQVVNPQYEAVSVAVKVWLVRGTDQNLAKYQLDQALRYFFSPWLSDPEKLPQFGRVVRRSHLIQMIEQLDYVDAIEELVVFHLIDKEAPKGAPTNSLDESGKPEWGTWVSLWEGFRVKGTLLTPGTARSILTTGAHTIEISDGVGGKGGPAPREALAPPEMPDDPAETREALAPPPTPSPQPTAKPKAQRKTSKRK